MIFLCLKVNSIHLALLHRLTGRFSINGRPKTKQCINKRNRRLQSTSHVVNRIPRKQGWDRSEK